MGRNPQCEHGRRKYECKECGGSQICEHGRQKSQCKECGGASICEHGRRKYYCKECGGASICEHGRWKYHCKECGGASICEHGRRKYYCKECPSARRSSERIDAPNAASSKRQKLPKQPASLGQTCAPCPPNSAAPLGSRMYAPKIDE